MITPAALRRGSRVAILAPATAVKSEYVGGAARFLSGRGFEVEIMPGTIDAPCGSYSATQRVRRDSLLEAYRCPDIDAILCARGGYGCVHLLDDELIRTMRANPKWMVGFSDISALHAASLRAGVRSVHSSMAKQLHLYPDTAPTSMLMQILEGGLPEVIAPIEGGIDGSARGILIGGNLAVLSGLAATPFDIFALPAERPCILFLEDVSEAIYAVERMLWRLHLAGVLRAVKGLIFGRFTEYNPDRNFSSMEAMLRARLEEWGVGDMPVALGFPVGHVDENVPLIEGADAFFEVSGRTATLKYNTITPYNTINQTK